MTPLFIVIYLVGYVLAYRTFRKNWEKDFGQWTVGDRIVGFATSLFSWVYFIVVALVLIGHKIKFDKPVRW